MENGFIQGYGTVAIEKSKQVDQPGYMAALETHRHCYPAPAMIYPADKLRCDVRPAVFESHSLDDHMNACRTIIYKAADVLIRNGEGTVAME